jgi:hypothetical protein
MGKVTDIRKPLPISKEVQSVVYAFDASIAKAIDEAKANGIPLGLLIAALHAHTTVQTLNMVKS